MLRLWPFTWKWVLKINKRQTKIGLLLNLKTSLIFIKAKIATKTSTNNDKTTIAT